MTFQPTVFTTLDNSFIFNYHGMDNWGGDWLARLKDPGQMTCFEVREIGRALVRQWVIRSSDAWTISLLLFVVNSNCHVIQWLDRGRGDNGLWGSLRAVHFKVQVRKNLEWNWGNASRVRLSWLFFIDFLSSTLLRARLCKEIQKFHFTIFVTKYVGLKFFNILNFFLSTFHFLQFLDILLFTISTH